MRKRFNCAELLLETQAILVGTTMTVKTRSSISGAVALQRYLSPGPLDQGQRPMGITQPSQGRLASRLWLVYAAATIFGSLLILAIYVNAYDNTGVTERLRATGAFTRTAMQVFSFPLGLPMGAGANLFLERRFGCANPNEPCAVFVDWWTHFGAVLAQVVLLRWFLRRSSR